MITQCPDCQTRFRLPLDQVTHSRGEVFCGKCRAQFNALEHLIIKAGSRRDRPTLTDQLQEEAGEICASTTDSARAPLRDPQIKGKRYELKQAVEAPHKRRRRSFGATLLSLAITILLIIVLGLQYLVVQREALSRNRYFRPLLTTICPHVGCTVPPRRSLALLAVIDNHIETHPQYPEALLISAELTNRGSFEQDYPIVELIMTDMQQQVVASRRFRPAEYLLPPADVQNGRFGANSTQRLQLEVVDPGSHATGFEFMLHNRTF